MTNEVYDITIIGGGPVGMFAGFYAGLREAKVQIIESLEQLGGQVAALYPEKQILDVAGFAGVSGRQLIQNLQDQLDTVPEVERHLNTKVTNVTRRDDYFTIETTQGTTRSRAVLLAAGNGSFKPRELRAENAEEETGKHLFYGISDLQRFANHDVLVAGGGDSAVDMALMLEPVANQVTLIHRRNEFRGLEKMVKKLEASSVQIVTPYLIQKLTETADDRVQVEAKRLKTDDDLIDLTVDDVVVNYGFIANNKDLQSWEVQPKLDHRLVQVNQELETSEPLLFCIGDQAIYPGKDTLIATGFGEAPVAVNTIMKRLYPDRRLPIHSTALKR
ncbi:NAD(P)/FAD-dependent oxidoreductase [Fructilactobacillus myrtifloralis]|uniref:Ferredoxin--NADP reductase n=2 Tax=Fructilactobacillus myrtifloralis TaxID=2940301 RepID=A0ABY5BLH4_9LACO|nr:NAD(P)/FAD-dependent oxidoreductase [Fructilactobacillus myrtifloralis]USS84467.1 NAD(P)/FAD-dependent oxidoreductase [Fructilactobacillus myrtifloralis]